MNQILLFLENCPYSKFIKKGLFILLIILITLLVLHYTSKFFQHLIERKIKNNKMTTLTMIVEKIIRGVVIFIALIYILELFGIHTTSILATAGIGTLVIGLGAQSLVKDFINGFFILSEKQYVAGEYIRVNDMEGYVKDIGFRMTTLVSYSGETFFVPNGIMNGVVNTSRTPMRALSTIHVPYDVDLDKTLALLSSLVPIMEEEKRSILKEPIEFLGVTKCNFSTLEITFRTYTIPEEQWGMERYMLKKSLDTLYRHHIPLPSLKEGKNASL